MTHCSAQSIEQRLLALKVSLPRKSTGECKAVDMEMRFALAPFRVAFNEKAYLRVAVAIHRSKILSQAITDHGPYILSLRDR